MANLLSQPGARNKKLRELLDRDKPLLAIASHDAMSARLAEQAGVEIVYMSGFTTSASLLGRPDVGLLTEVEMVGNARRIVQTVQCPVVADADTGYGNEINVIRTVRDYEQAGVSGIHLEDQVFPKRCGHMAGKAVIPAHEMVAKFKAASQARLDPNFVLIARTDALAVEGLQPAIDRVKRYADAGADLLWVEAPTSVEQLEEISEQLKGYKTALNWVQGGLTPLITYQRICELGFRYVFYPLGSILEMTTALQRYYAYVLAHGTPDPSGKGVPTFDQFTDIVGLPEVTALEEQASKV